MFRRVEEAGLAKQTGAIEHSRGARDAGGTLDGGILDGAAVSGANECAGGQGREQQRCQSKSHGLLLDRLAQQRKSLHRPGSRRFPRSGDPKGLFRQGVGEAGDKLDELGLAPDTGPAEEMAEMGLRRSIPRRNYRRRSSRVNASGQMSELTFLRTPYAPALDYRRRR